MAKTAQEFLDHLAAGGLVPPEVIENLRRQVAKATKPVAAGTVARLLVDRGHLTAAQGERLIGGSLPPAKEAKPTAAAAKNSSSSSSFLGLEPIDPEHVVKPAAKPAPSAKPTAPSKSGIASPSKPAATTGTATAKSKPAPEPLLEGLQPLAPLPGDDLFGVAPLADPFADAPAFTSDPFASIPATSVAGTTLSSPTSALVPAAAQPLAATKAATAARSGRRVWPMIVGVVVILLAIGGVAGFLLTRSNGDKEFELAEQDYQAKQYAPAIAKYDGALERFPASPRAGQARLHRGMAQIMAATATKDNWSAILPATKKALSEIGQDADVAQLQADLAPLLTDMAAGLVEQARQGKTAQESAERLAEAKEALILANDGRFVPGTLRQWQRLTDVEESIAIIQHDLGRSKALDTALAEIKKAAEAGKLAAADAQRAKLLLAYPELAMDTSLRDSGVQIAKAAAAAVKSAADSSKAESGERKSEIQASVSLASSQPAAAAMTPGKTFFALAAGSVWALDGGSGKLLWSRPVGHSSGSAVVPVSPDPAGDVVFTDLNRNEVLCVEARGGAIRWRHEFKEALTGDPLSAAGQVLVTTREGKVVALDAKTGSGKVAAQLPQAARFGPVTTDSKHAYQLGASSYLYALSTTDLKCEGAIYIGHEVGSVEVPPIPLARHLVVVENSSASARLHVVPLDDKGQLANPSQQVEIAGQVTTPPVLIGERLLVLTDRQTVAFDYVAAQKEPLKKLGETEAASVESFSRFGLAHAGKVWIAADGLRKFDFLPANGTLKEAWSGFANAAFDAPPQAADDTIFCLRRAAGSAGFVAAALKAASGQPLWETHLAQTLVVHVTAGGQSVVLLSNGGAAATLDLASLKGHIPLHAVSPSTPSPQQAALSPPLAAVPTAWSGGLLCVSHSGSVDLLDSQTGAPLAEPFQMSVKAGKRIGNCSLAQVKPEGDIVVSDGGSTLYLLHLEKEPQPRIAPVAKVVLKTPLISGVAVLDDSAFVVDQSGELQLFSLPDLKAGKTAKLDCHALVHGPVRLDKSVLIATDRGDLLCFDGSGKELWKLSLADGPLAGAPLAAEGDLLLTTTQGLLIRLSAESGKEIARTDLAQPLAGSPVMAGNFALVPTAAGGVLKVSLPKKK